MYLQEIVISPDIFEKISKFYSYETDEYINLRSFIENLKLKKVLLDDTNEKSKINIRIDSIINSSRPEAKLAINDIRKKFLISDRNEFKNNTGKDFCNDELQNLILNLCLQTESKIVNSEDKSSLSIKDKYKELEELEILDLNDFNDPPSRSKQFCNNRKILIPRGEIFKFQYVLNSYFIDTKKIIVSDKYLRREDSFNNLVKLLKLCRKLEELKIFTISRDNASNDNFELKFTTFKERLKFEFDFLGDNLKIPQDCKIKHERILITDRFILEFGPGFNFVDDKFKAKKDNIIIRIDKITDKEVETYSDIMN